MKGVLTEPNCCREPYFGVDLDAELRQWFEANLVPELKEEYGEGLTFAFVLLDNDLKSRWSWQTPLNHVAHLLTIGGERCHEPGNVIENIGGKLSFTLEHLLDSAAAHDYPELLREGNFPYKGAVFNYRGFTGGVSGLPEDDDPEVFKRIVDEYVEQRRRIARLAVKISKVKEGRPLGRKYLRDIDVVRDGHLIVDEA